MSVHIGSAGGLAREESYHGFFGNAIASAIIGTAGGNMHKIPYFHFYFQDFFNDESVLLMTDSQQIGYLKLLCFQWQEGSVPDSVFAISKVTGWTKKKAQDFYDQFFLKSSLFERLEEEDGTVRWVNPRMKHEKDFFEEKSRKLSENGKKRWSKPSPPETKTRKKKSSAVSEPLPEEKKSESNDSIPLFPNQDLSESNSGTDGTVATDESVTKSPSKEPPAKKEPYQFSKPCKIPPDIQLTEKMYKFAKEKLVQDPAREFEAFKDYFFAKGTEWSDWNRTWMRWVNQGYEKRKMMAGSSEQRTTLPFNPAKKIDTYDPNKKPLGDLSQEKLDLMKRSKIRPMTTPLAEEV